MAYSSIINPRNFMNTVLYTGNATARSITGVGFQPDLVWIKPYTNGAWSHNLTDSVRGAGYGLFADLNNTQYNYGTGTDGSVRTFDSDGFSIGNKTQVNNNSSNIVAWNWKAGGSASSNSSGSITSSVSANTTSGFSIVTYTGTGSNATVGHGLGAVPTMIIAKETTGSANDWTVYHVTQGSTTRGILNETNAWGSNTAWNNTTPTSSVFSIGSGSVTNRNNSTYTAYCFADVQGFSKMGSYIGNGESSNGPFVYTGFKPSFIIRKNTDGGVTESWIMQDNKRNTSNVVDKWLEANNTATEDTAYQTDFLSNGFKMRSNNDGTNRNSTTYIYMAFAEEPFVASNFNTATAR